MRTSAFAYNDDVLPWAITRADVDARRVVNELRAAGVHAFALPCIEPVLRPVPRWSPEGHRVVVLTSTGAVEAVRLALASAAPHDLAAIAPTTSQALRELGFRPTVEGFSGVVPLAEAIEQHLRRRRVTDAVFWYPSSDAGTQSAEQHEAVRRLELLGPVTRPIVYEMRAPATLEADIAALPPRYGVFFASPSAVSHFVAARPVPPERVVCWGESTLHAARAAFPQAVQADRARPLTEAFTTEESRHV